MRTSLLTCLCPIFILAASPAAAQHVSLDIRNGQVTLDARDTTLQQILSEWARLAGVQVVNADRVVGSSITLLLRDVSERQALDILLRNQQGYVLVRQPEGVTATSAFRRILILPRTTTTTTRENGLLEPGVPLGFSGGGFSQTASGDVQAALQTSTQDASATGPIYESILNRPPTPLLPPVRPGPTPGNSFGSFPAGGGFGTVTPVGPPPGVVYPPVTDPNARGAPPPPPKR